MSVVLPTLDQVEQRVLNRLKGTPLSDLQDGSVVRMLIRAILEEVAGTDGLYETHNRLGQAAHLGSAVDAELDGVGTNYGPLGTRQNSETDAEYRYRLSQIVQSQRMGSFESIRVAAGAVSGVLDVAMKPYAFGPGSLALAYMGSAVLANVRDAANRWVAPGTYFNVYKSREQVVQLKIAVRCVQRSTAEERAAAKSAAASATTRYLRSLMMGNSLSLDELKRSINSSHSAIVESQIRAIISSDTTLPLRDLVVPWDTVITPATVNPVTVTEI